MMMLHRTDWASIKQIRIDNGTLTLYYVQDGSGYTIVEGDRKQIYWVVLHPGADAADITDWETTYKSGATVVLSLDDAISKILLGQDTDEEIVTAVNNTDITLNNILGQLGGTPTTTTIIKEAEFAIDSRNETDVTGVTYTVPAGKEFRLVQFAASSDNPAGTMFRLKVLDGATVLHSIKIVIQPNGGSVPFTWPGGIKFADAGNVVKVTREAQAQKGTGWTGFAGLENDV